MPILGFFSLGLLSFVLVPWPIRHMRGPYGTRDNATFYILNKQMQS